MAPRQLEQIAEQFSCALLDDDRVRLGYSLQARREIRCLADNRLLLSRTRTNQVADDNESGGDADPRFQRSTCLQRIRRCDQLQPGPRRPFGVILMGLRVAEIDQDAIAQIFCYVAAEGRTVWATHF